MFCEVTTVAIVIKTVKNRKYAYIAFRVGKKVVHQYLGSVDDPEVKKRIGCLTIRKALPESMYRLFWDVDPAGIDLKRHSRYIIERVLEFGNLTDVCWLQRHYPTAHIMEVCESSRRLSQKSRNFWRIWFEEETPH